MGTALGASIMTERQTTIDTKIAALALFLIGLALMAGYLVWEPSRIIVLPGQAYLKGSVEYGIWYFVQLLSIPCLFGFIACFFKANAQKINFFIIALYAASLLAASIPLSILQVSVLLIHHGAITK